MIVVYSVLGAVSVLSAGLSGTFYLRKNPRLRFVFKFVASLCFFFLGIAATASAQLSVYAVLVLSALSLGMLGDLFLCSEGLVLHQNKIMFDAFGLLTFLGGHLFFIALFFSTTPFDFRLLPVALILTVGLCASIAVKAVSFGKLTPVFLIYSVVLGLMVVSTLNYYLSAPSLKSTLALSAGVLFALSDSLIIFKDYGKRKGHPVLVYAVLITYYVAQCLFAVTIALNH